MNRIFTKKVLPLVLAAGLVLGLGGCSQRVPEQGDVPDSIDELSEGMPSDKEEEPQQLSLQQSNEEKNPLEDQLAGEKPEDKPKEEEPAKETEEKKEEDGFCKERQTRKEQEEGG